MPDWIADNGVILTVATAASIAIIVASIFLVPAAIVRIPEDYFTHDKRPPGIWAGKNPTTRIALAIATNVLGVVLIAAGIAMLLLPGQGVLTLLVGVLLISFPGKYRFEKWLISRKRVLRVINWLRRRRKRPPLQAPKHSDVKSGQKKTAEVS